MEANSSFVSTPSYIFLPRSPLMASPPSDISIVMKGGKISAEIATLSNFDFHSPRVYIFSFSYLWQKRWSFGSSVERVRERTVEEMFFYDLNPQMEWTADAFSRLFFSLSPVQDWGRSKGTMTTPRRKCCWVYHVRKAKEGNRKSVVK